MFEKVPYGVKVRVKGSIDTGYVVEEAICTYRFLPFLDSWVAVSKFSGGKRTDIFTDYDEAQEFAQVCYDNWMKYYATKEEAKRQRKIVAKSKVLQIPG